MRLRFALSPAARVALVTGTCLVLLIAFSVLRPHDEATKPETSDQAGSVNAQHDFHESLWDRTTEDPVAFFTFVLAVSTGVLVLVTGTQISFLIRADKNAARSIEIARSQFLATVRPRLIVREVVRGEGGDDEGISFRIVNAGGSKATITESHVVTVLRGFNEPVPARIFAKSTPASLFKQTLAAGEAASGVWVENADDLTLGLADARPEDLRLFLVGYVVYDDEAGIRRRTGFCRVREKGGRFRTVEDPDYEYTD